MPFPTCGSRDKVVDYASVAAYLSRGDECTRLRARRRLSLRARRCPNLALRIKRSAQHHSVAFGAMPTGRGVETHKVDDQGVARERRADDCGCRRAFTPAHLR